MRIVSATEAKTLFGRTSSTALSEPVIIEKHNRPELVLMSYNEFISLKRMATLSTVDTCQQSIAGDQYAK
ncbi:type II toxin-antitoxin system Phd/YefM family antitoxin [Piscirickettsia litoralis]|uniref:Antitoxin n=1 Tax=Piscirickettsia litoralis TaxID=1891921 RepID=A0ABX3A1R3_9GAMM|nr:hypothetical protein BGC07_16370 [Piscirickettsia litoralis]